jgi:hypothetical protein
MQIILSSPAYTIVSVHNRVTYITNEVLASKNDSVCSERIGYLNTPKRLANCKINSKYCSASPYKKFPWYPLYSIKKSTTGLGNLDVNVNCV